MDTPLEIVWPFWKWIFGCCMKKRVRKFKLGLKRALRSKLELKVPKSDLLIEKDPYLLLGYGMNSYFEVMLQLMWLCCLICIVTVPLSLVYAQGGGFTGMNAYTLGSLGGADVYCTQAPFSIDGSSAAISCPANTLIDMDGKGQNGELVTSVGMISSESPVKNWCSASALATTPEYDCSSYLKTSSILDDMRTKCQGLDTCELVDLGKYVSDLTNAPAGCKAAATQIFLQVPCLVPEDQLASRELKGLALACCAVFISLFTINYLDYVKKVQENNYIEWDIKTITAGDYTIEFDIAPSFFQKYLEQENDRWQEKMLNEEGTKYMTPQEAFKDWIMNEMETRLSDMPDCGMEDEPVDKVKIAKATMAFKNSEIIHLLRARGAAIKGEKWEDQAKIEGQINDLKTQKLDELTTPCSIFMTF